jgi:lipocalin
MSFQYSLYGLQFDSTLAISILAETVNSRADLTVTWVDNINNTPDRHLNWESIITNELKKRKRLEFFRAYTEEGHYSKVSFINEDYNLDFLLSPDKRQLWIIYDKDEAINNLESYFVGPILGCVLRMMGTICLHASVININGKAIILSGDKRSGKSTTAAAFVKMGYSVLADDVAVITEREDGFYVEPGYSKVRLRPASVAFIYPNNMESLPMVYTRRDSRYMGIENNFCDTALPLGAIYLMDKNDDGPKNCIVEKLSMQSKLINLCKNTFGAYVVTKDMRKQEFDLLGKIAHKEKVSKLFIINGLENLYKQCQAIIDDLK